MKKFFAIAAIATVLVACGDAKTTTEEATKTDSTSAPATNAATQVAGAVDSAAKATDTVVVKPVIDSLNK